VPPRSLFSDARGFEPAARHPDLSLAASDYLDPLFLPQLVTQIKQQAPHCGIEILPLSAERLPARLAQGDMDVVIGNWLKPPDDLHLGRLFGDEVVCLVARDHPAVRRSSQGGWDPASWLAAEHIAPTPTHPGARA
jgi:DNA-binding transcriptional LysR family regulator